MRRAALLVAITLLCHASAAQVERDCKTELERLESANQRLQSERSRLEQELAVIRHGSEHILRLTEERSALQHEVAQLTRRVADLEQQNLDLRNERKQRWFLIGAGVLASGVLIGLVIPQLRLRRRKTPWGSL